MGDTRHVLRLWHVWAVWALFGLLTACRLYAQGAAAGPPLSFARALLLGQVYAHLYFLATLPVLSLAGRYPLWRGDRPAPALLYALACVLFAASVPAAQGIFQTWLGSPAGPGGVTPGLVAAATLEGSGEAICVFWLAALAPCAFVRHVGRGREGLGPPPAGAEAPRRGSGALRERLRPHLLFNTLNSIVTLMHEDVKAAEATLINTSAFLRGALSESREAPLRFELDTLKGYLHMEAAGLEEGVRVTFDVEPSAELALVPNRLLLPLAENAVRHGSGRAGGGRRIEVEARREGDRLRIRISNDCDADAAGRTSPRPGTGLAETGRLLSSLYGPGHRFEARYAAGTGFLVDIEIPFREHAPAAG